MSRYRYNRLQVKNGMVTITLGSLNYELDGSIEEAIECLKKKQRMYAAEYTNIRLSWDSAEYDGGNDLNILGDRPATEGEKEAQAAEDAEQKAQNEKWELEQLKRLQEKYK